jgi:hypothetical protein
LKSAPGQSAPKSLPCSSVVCNAKHVGLYWFAGEGSNNRDVLSNPLPVCCVMWVSVERHRGPIQCHVSSVRWTSVFWTVCTFIASWGTKVRQILSLRTSLDIAGNFQDCRCISLKVSPLLFDPSSFASLAHDLLVPVVIVAPDLDLLNVLLE